MRFSFLWLFCSFNPWRAYPAPHTCHSCSIVLLATRAATNKVCRCGTSVEIGVNLLAFSSSPGDASIGLLTWCSIELFCVGLLVLWVFVDLLWIISVHFFFNFVCVFVVCFPDHCFFACFPLFSWSLLYLFACFGVFCLLFSWSLSCLAIEVGGIIEAGSLSIVRLAT